MKIALKVQPNYKPFFYWINERHNIYIARHNGLEWPWTNDPILQQYRFCNVFRELDKVTIWIRKNWREPFWDHPNLWFAMCIARQINHPETLEEIGFPSVWSPERVRKIMKARAARKETVYTGAYIITAGGRSGSKIDYTIDGVLDPIYRDRKNLMENWYSGPNTLRHVWDCLLEYQGFGPFLSYEVVTDLRHTKYLKNADDIMTWANAGPGAKRGLNRIWGRPYKFRLPQEQALREMQHLLKESQKPGMLHPDITKLEMRDIEHSLCEVDKMLRVKNGEGRPRSRYGNPNEH